LKIVIDYVVGRDAAPAWMTRLLGRVVVSDGHVIAGIADRMSANP